MITLTSPSSTQIFVNGIPHPNDKDRQSRLYYFSKLVQTMLLRPITTGIVLTFRTVKLLTWIPAKAALYLISGFHSKSAVYFESEYLKTVKAARDVLFIPSLIKRNFQDFWISPLTSPKDFVDDIARMAPEDYLQVPYTKGLQQLSSYMHGFGTFEVTYPKGITEFAARSDGSLKTIMASHLFKPAQIAINFGSPNVATFITKEEKDHFIQTYQVDAKSLNRAEMTYHETNGKIQSGVFLVPTNLPDEALHRFEAAAKELQGRKDFTCVNTNCRVLQRAGFSIEGVEMEQVYFPTTLMEHLLFRKVFYTDLQGTTHQVHFDILNTTTRTLEKYLEDVDTAVVNTRIRHRRRNADTEENQKARGAAAQAIIAEEEKRLAALEPTHQVNHERLEQRKMTISVPSLFGNAIARFWGRHTIYEVDLTDYQDKIFNAFSERIGEPAKLCPFLREKPGMITRLKKYIFFSGPMIRFLRRHIMGHADRIHQHTQDLFNYLKSTDGAHLNYALLDDKVVLAKVHANGESNEVHRKAADWALSKHALLANRKEVYCSGEMWYDKNKNRFMMNDDSGTYEPSFERVKIVADLANEIFDAHRFGNIFEAVSANQNSKIA